MKFVRVSRKVIAAAVAGALVNIVAWAVAYKGLSLDPAVSAEVSTVAALVGGFVAGFLKKELPQFVED